MKNLAIYAIFTNIYMMEFFRRVFGFNSVPNEDRFSERNHMDEEYPYFTPFTFPFFNHPNSEAWESSSPNGYYHQEYGSIDPFQQMHQMMEMLDRAMSSMDFLDPGYHSQLMPPPNSSPGPSTPLSPRDRFLKTPDSLLPPEALPDSATPSQDSHEALDDSTTQEFHHHEVMPFQNPHGSFGFGSIFRMMDEMLRPFSRGDTMRPYNEPDVPEGYGLHSPPARENLLKEDQDLDKQPRNNLQELLKDGPGYSGAPAPLIPHEPTVRRSFTSTSISRTVRPDGVIEERRTYRDSSGKEEVTVTEIQPGTASSLVPDPFVDGGFSSSFFGKFFR
ncbi:HCLS1-associated protein X-1 isoform X2 [Hyalella azteca]|uniref:HCLS1-associated protein X-1 isoform X2 n=1 Tax=Hyalella azteca TaxID=294128 RepID=A0A8B7PMN9_HYAAZ|nr:HCLS1-associated protein X-1 isoform X2 [Hyalella azteca]